MNFAKIYNLRSSAKKKITFPMRPLQWPWSFTKLPYAKLTKCIMSYICAILSHFQLVKYRRFFSGPSAPVVSMKRTEFLANFNVQYFRLSIAAMVVRSLQYIGAQHAGGILKWVTGWVIGLGLWKGDAQWDSLLTWFSHHVRVFSLLVSTSSPGSPEFSDFSLSKYYHQTLTILWVSILARL